MNTVLSKAVRKVQWATDRSGAVSAILPLCLGLGLSLGLSAGLEGCARKPPTTGGAAERKTPSGLPVPRYVSLKFGVVNARGGPGDDYKLKWIYHVRDLPLQVVAETEDWRRVCDSDGQISWVHRRTVAERRTVLVEQAHDLVLRKRPDDGAAASATIVSHALADLDVCKGGWCRLRVGRSSGWAPANLLWGVADGPQCRAP
jgi:SH3-like domain-containing protein